MYNNNAVLIFFVPVYRFSSLFVRTLPLVHIHSAVCVLQIIVGDYGLSYDQQRVQMGMWALMASPLLLSSNLRTVPPASKALLQNRALLAINQDPLGIQGTRISQVNTFTQTHQYQPKHHL